MQVAHGIMKHAQEQLNAVVKRAQNSDNINSATSLIKAFQNGSKNHGSSFAIQNKPAVLIGQGSLQYG